MRKKLVRVDLFLTYACGAVNLREFPTARIIIHQPINKEEKSASDASVVDILIQNTDLSSE
jgi:hypothetical protein